MGLLSITAHTEKQAQWVQENLQSNSVWLYVQRFESYLLEHSDHDRGHAKNIYTTEIHKRSETGFSSTISNSQCQICLVSGDLVSANIIT